MCFTVFNFFFLYSTKRRWPFFCIERVGLSDEGFIITFLHTHLDHCREWRIRNYGKTVRSFLACVSPLSPSIGLRLPPYIQFFFSTKKTILQLYITYTVIVFSYYVRVRVQRKGFAHSFFFFFWGKIRWHGQLGLPGTQWFNPIRWLLVLSSLLFCFRDIRIPWDFKNE